MRAAETGAAEPLVELRQERDRARAGYLAAPRQVPRDTAERGRLWRAFAEANAAYLRVRGKRTMTPLAYVGTDLTITDEAVLLDGGKHVLAYAAVDEVRVYPHALGEGARLVLTSPDIVLARNYAEAWMAHQACRILLHAMNDRGAYARGQRMRGEHLEARRS